ncbi:MAG TPA: hypothetical protein VHU80_22705, partial [Polyangiaceae bacterium]|nr:hypothetical protein [Polyangiaceae bacterium]
PVAAPPRDVEGERQLSVVAPEHERMESRLAAVAPHDREQCEFQVGDCGILVKEEREELMKSEELSECRVMPDASGVMRCMADGLVKRRKQGKLATFYSNEVGCMQTVLTCTAALTKTAQDAAATVRAGAREEDLRKLPRGAAAMNAMAAADDEIAYLRATLPPTQTSACDPDAQLDQCNRTANAAEDAFEGELAKDQLDQGAALGLLETFAKARSACSDPQIACLSTTLEAHGLYPEGKKWVARNFAALERREELGAGVASGARARCINEASKAHQSRIVGAYVAYSRDAVLFFRMQLDKAFLAMHEAQLACLEGHASRGRTATATTK